MTADTHRAVLVTGASGFLGRALAPALSQSGFVLEPLERDGALPQGTRGPHDVAATIHLAFPTSAAERRRDPPRTRADVHRQTSGLLAATRAWGARHVILASSGKVYGAPCYLPIDEGHPTAPTTELGRLKLLQESLVNAAVKGSGSAHDDPGPRGPLGATILRIFNVYGPGQRSDFLVPHLIQGFARQTPTPLGELNHARDWLHVDDVAAAIALTVDQPAEPGTIRVMNVASSQAVTPRAILQLMESAFGRPLPFVHDPARLRPDEPGEEWATSHPLEALGWRRRLGLQEGLASIIDPIRRRRP